MSVRPRHRALLMMLGLAASLGAADVAAFEVRIEVRGSKGKPFAQPARVLCREWYPKIHAALFGAGYPLPFPEIKVVFEPALTAGF